MAKILLRREELIPDKLDGYGATPLSVAAQNGHDSVVKLIFGQEAVSIDKPDDGGRTPF